MILSDIRARMEYKDGILVVRNISIRDIGDEIRGSFDHPTPRFDRSPVYKALSGTKITYIYPDDVSGNNTDCIILKIEP